MALTHLQVGPYQVLGRSLGGFYTSLFVPELKSLFDVGAAFRAGSTARNLFLSHGHADHLGALPALLGMRGLMGVKVPMRIFAPAKVASKLPEFLDSFSGLHHWPLEVDLVPLDVGDEVKVHNDLWVKAIQTFHPVPSLGYVISRRVKKLKQEFLTLPGAEIKRLKAEQAHLLFDTVDKPEFAYVTDTLPEVLTHHPELYDVRVLVLECTFLDGRKSVKHARAGCHIHLEELRPHLSRFKNTAVLLMHFSQLYQPAEVRQILQHSVANLDGDRFHFMLPPGDGWWE